MARGSAFRRSAFGVSLGAIFLTCTVDAGATGPARAAPDGVRHSGEQGGAIGRNLKQVER